MPPASKHRFFFVPFILLAGCATEEELTDVAAQACDETPIGQWIQFDAPPRPSLDRYPDLGDGRVLLSREAGVDLVLDSAQRNPVTTLSGCSYWLRSCFEAHGNLDDCYLSSPRCEGDTPWLDDRLCCPTACYDDYAQRRREGVTPMDAMVAVAEARSCFPGLDAYVAGGAQ
jgi:hypothetical protein